MLPSLLAFPAGLALVLLIVHLRAQYDREQRAREELRRRYPTIYGGPRL